MRSRVLAALEQQGRTASPETLHALVRIVERFNGVLVPPSPNRPPARRAPAAIDSRLIVWAYLLELIEEAGDVELVHDRELKPEDAARFAKRAIRPKETMHAACRFLTRHGLVRFVVAEDGRRLARVDERALFLLLLIDAEQEAHDEAQREDDEDEPLLAPQQTALHYFRTRRYFRSRMPWLECVMDAVDAHLSSTKHSSESSS